jgi:integrase
MSNRSAIRPKLHDCSGDLSKRWFVYYSYLNPATGKMKRFKRYDGFNDLSSVDARLKHAEALISQINRKFDSGWNPFQDNERFLYKNVSSTIVEVGDIGNPIATPEFTIEYFLNYSLERKRGEIREISFASYYSQIQVFLRWLRKCKLDNYDIGQLSRNHMENFLNDLKKAGRNNTTRNSYHTNLKGLFKILNDQQVIKANPFEKINSLPQNKQSKKAFSKAQIQAIKENITEKEPQLWLFIQAMYYTCIRPRELRYLKLCDVSVDEGKIFIRSEISKNKKSQYVTIPMPFKQQLNALTLDRYPGNYFLFGKRGIPGLFPCCRNHFYNIHREILKSLEFSSDYSLYSWKHTGVKEAVKNGVPLKEIQLQLRHHSLDQVDQYLRSLGIVECEGIKNQFPVI